MSLPQNGPREQKVLQKMLLSKRANLSVELLTRHQLVQKNQKVFCTELPKTMEMLKQNLS